MLEVFQTSLHEMTYCSSGHHKPLIRYGYIDKIDVISANWDEPEFFIGLSISLDALPRSGTMCMPGTLYGNAEQKGGLLDHTPMFRSGIYVFLPRTKSPFPLTQSLTL